MHCSRQWTMNAVATIAALLTIAFAPPIESLKAASPKTPTTTTVPLQVQILIDASTKGIAEGQAIKQIETLAEEPAGKQELLDVKDKRGKVLNDRIGIYQLKEVKLTPSKGGPMNCRLLISIEPGKTVLRDVKYEMTLTANSGNKTQKWYAYTGVFDIAAPDAAAFLSDVKRDLDKMQGTWRVVSSQVGDEKAASDELKRRRVTIDGTKLTYEYGNERHEKRIGTIEIDPTTKTLEWSVTSPEPSVTLALYELKGTELRIGFGNDGIMPKKMEIGKDNVAWMLVLKRE